MKKKTAAISHISNDPGPNFAVVPRCLRPRTATRLKRTRSRSLSPRTRCGGSVICVTLEDGRWKDERWEANAPGSSLRARLRRGRQRSERTCRLSIANSAPDPRRSAAAVQHGMDADSIRLDSVIDSEWKAPTQAPMITKGLGVHPAMNG